MNKFLSAFSAANQRSRSVLPLLATRSTLPFTLSRAYSATMMSEAPSSEDGRDLIFLRSLNLYPALHS